MNSAINNRLAVLTSYYAQIDEEIATYKRIVDTYDGMLSHCNNAEGCEPILAGLDRATDAIALLKNDRAEIDHMWNESLLATETI